MAADQKAEFKSTRAKVDPVSGNEVPTGSLPEEVRDDIPAALSEGEYVVPADVVRYYGVKFFEDLRNEAKSGWSDMEANGRVGGEPMGMEMGGDELPFDVSELQMMDDGEPEGMYEGGYMAGYNQGSYAAPTVPENMSAIQQEFPNSFVGGPAQSAEEYRTYQNAQGMTITIRFINGKPVTPIPEGYTAVDAAAKTVAPTQRVINNDDGPTAPKVEPKESIDWMSKDVGAEKFNEVMDSMYSKTGKGALAIAGAINPILGIAGGLAKGHQEKRMLEALDKRIEAGETDLRDVRNKLLGYVDMNADGKRDNIVERSGIFGGEDSMTEGLLDRDGGGAGFADTWLGDLLGFDGTAGVQGPSLAASRAGARRGEVADDDNSSNAAVNYGSAATGSTVIVDAPDDDGDTNRRKVTTYDPEEVKKISKAGGFNTGGR